MFNKKKLAVLVAASALSGLAHANLFDGKTIDFSILYPTIDAVPEPGLSGSYLVGAGVEIDAPGVATIDFSDTTLYGVYQTSIPFGSMDFVGYRFSDALGDIDSFASVTINPATNVAGFDASRISFDADHIWVNMAGLTVFAGDVLSVDVAAVAAVPEPETYAMFLAGLGMLGAVVRRRS